MGVWNECMFAFSELDEIIAHIYCLLISAMVCLRQTQSVATGTGLWPVTYVCHQFPSPWLLNKLICSIDYSSEMK